MFKVLGVSGPIASGKSFFIKKFISECEKQDVVYYHFDADIETHKLIPDNEERKKILTKIKNNKELYKKHTEEIQRQVFFCMCEQLKDFYKETQDNYTEKAVFIIDAALFYTAYWDVFADVIFCIYSSDKIRKERYLKRNTNSFCNFEEIDKYFEIEKDIDRQCNKKVKYKINNSDYILQNSLDLVSIALLKQLFKD